MTHKLFSRLLQVTALAAATFVTAPELSAQDDAKTDMTAYILTPAPAKTPRINCAKVVGARPGSDFLFTVAATGDRPMKFSAEGLPKGLTLNQETGIITGKVKKEGEYIVKLCAENALGKYERNLKIVIGDKIALTPPMGWNSWNCWGNSVSQEKVITSARAIVESGLINHGWTYVNIDDGWQGIRGGEHNAIMGNAKFPDMKALADEIHSMGLKLGIYSTPWVGTYAGHIGSYSDNEDGTYDWIKEGTYCNENYRYVKPNDPKRQARKEHYYHGKKSWVEADVRQWVDWGIDYLKYDWGPNDYYYAKEMHDALKDCGRDIVYSISNSAPYADAAIWAEYTNCYRTTGDIRDNWKSINDIGFSQDKWIGYTGPGYWPDADMLVIGSVGGWGLNLKYTKLTADEQYTHMSLWALISSPLLIGCDLAQADPFTLSLLTNDEVIDINQDPLGIHAAPVWRDGDDAVIYVKHLEDGSMAVGFFNRTEEPREMSVTLKQLGLRGEITFRDVWRQKDLETVQTGGSFSTEVAPHGVTLVRVSPGNPKDRKIGFVKK